MYISELARRAHVSVQAIRLYERRRLLPRPARSASGYRCFTERDLEILRVISVLKRFGCTLAEIRDFLALYAVPDPRTGRTRYPRGSSECLREALEMGARKLAALDRRIEEMKAIRGEMRRMLEEFRARLITRRSS